MAQPGGRDLSSEAEKMSNILSLVNTFKAFDSDNDGSITAAELGGILSSLGHTASEEDVSAMVQQADKDKDGLLSLEEFLEMNTKDMELGSLRIFLTSALGSMDADEDEILTGEELHEMAENLGFPVTLADCQNMIAALDENGDGAVSFEEFQLLVNSLFD
ncbi:probable calcium-binding protein CML29 [Mangifera indica]|uniref:probable calcium-binding protein CML29 n=1 Tax=Mangifera indica TaxID=29780 RepID=UPI001CFBE04B|nr:probable calcium-binding protein CML29 [Mangifera indica]